MRRDILGARDNSVLRAKFLYIYFMFQAFCSHEAETTGGVRDISVWKVGIALGVKLSRYMWTVHNEISRWLGTTSWIVRMRFYQNETIWLRLPETSRCQVFSYEPGTVSSLQHRDIPTPEISRLMWTGPKTVKLINTDLCDICNFNVNNRVWLSIKATWIVSICQYQ